MHYNCCVKMACVNDDLDAILFFVSRMKERGLDPDVITYSSIVHSYAKRGDTASSMCSLSFFCCVCLFVKGCVGSHDTDTRRNGLRMSYVYVFVLRCAIYMVRIVSIQIFSFLPTGIFRADGLFLCVQVRR